MDQSTSPRHRQLLLQAAPFLRRGVTTRGLMLDVLYSALPVLLSSLWYFGLSALLLTVATMAGCMAIEWAWGRRGSLADASGAVTGLLLAMSLPPGLPLWMGFLGGAAASGLGKLVWGGLGQNLFNPSLVGRAFLQAAFPTVMTTWTAQKQLTRRGLSEFFSLPPSTLAWPLMRSPVDAVSTATPLARMKFERQGTSWFALLVGNTSGSLGETNVLVISLAGLYMAARRTFDWRIPLAVLASVAVCSGALLALSPDYPSPLFMLLSGGLLFGTVFMATDPVTSPMAPRGAALFGAGIGLLVVLIRVFGGLPEGVMYAILLMNAATPLIDRYARPRPFGRKDSKGTA